MTDEQCIIRACITSLTVVAVAAFIAVVVLIFDMRSWTMREIKFRGFNGEKWLYGDLNVDYKTKQAMISDDRWWRHPVRFDTVGQYTGLKDSTGKEIYEGDVLRDPDGRTLEVVWNNGAGSWECVREDYHFLFIMRYIDVMTVIGNVHDNPDLLEVEA